MNTENSTKESGYGFYKDPPYIKPEYRPKTRVIHGLGISEELCHRLLPFFFVSDTIKNALATELSKDCNSDGDLICDCEYALADHLASMLGVELGIPLDSYIYDAEYRDTFQYPLAEYTPGFLAEYIVYCLETETDREDIISAIRSLPGNLGDHILIYAGFRS